jgi:hypothetical protein
VSNPPPDASQLWNNTFHDTSAQAAAMTGEAEAARAAMAGESDHFARQQAEERMAFAQQQASNFQYQAQQYQQQQFVVAQHNEPIQAALAAQSEQQSTAALTGALSLAATVATVGYTASAMGGLSEREPGTMGPASSFAETIGAPSAAEPMSFTAGPTSLFNSRGWDAKNAFGIEPSLGDMPSLTTAAAIAGVGTPAAPKAAAPDDTAPAALAAAPLRRPNASMHLGMAMAPKPSMDFFEKMGGGKT